MRAALRPRSDGKGSANQLRAFAHANQPNSPLHLLCNKPGAVILDFKFQGISQVFQADPSITGTRMAAHIVQSFLKHAIDVHAGARFHRKRLAALFVVQLDACLFACRGNIPVQSAFQAASSSKTGWSAWESVRILFSVVCAISCTSFRSLWS